VHHEPAHLPLTVRPAGWRPSDRQLAAVADFLLEAAKRQLDRAAQRPDASAERAVTSLFEQQT
jgi:hypothetical protein